MLIYECVQLVYIAVDYDVKTVIDRVVLGDLLRGEGLGHCRWRCGVGASGIEGRMGLSPFDRALMGWKDAISWRIWATEVVWED